MFTTIIDGRLQMARVIGKGRTGLQRKENGRRDGGRGKREEEEVNNVAH